MSSNIFKDVAAFNEAAETRIAGPHGPSSKLYQKLFAEELQETALALQQLRSTPADDVVGTVNATTELADGLLDTIYIAVGWLRAMGLGPQELWDEVHRSNMAKADPVTCKLLKREDGKVIKPEGWQPPQLKPIVARHLGYIKRAGKDIDGQLLERSKVGKELKHEDEQLIEPSYTPEQAAIRANMSASWVRAQIKAGKLRAVKRGSRATRIPQSALVEFLGASA